VSYGLSDPLLCPSNAANAPPTDRFLLKEWEAVVSARKEIIERIENERYTSEGVYAWLEHSKGLGKIRNFIDFADVR
jgi:hypothetical protein